MTGPDRDAEAEAKQRFFLLNFVRLAGVLVTFIGLAILQQALQAPKEFGYLLVLAGFAIFFLWPNALRRSWKADAE